MDHNSPEEITNGLITFGLSAQAQWQNANLLIKPLLPRDTKYWLRQGNINVINTVLFSKCSKHNLYTFKHQLVWSNINRWRSKYGLHLIKMGMNY